MDGITPEAVNAYFTPLDYGLYLMAIFVIMVVWYQWKWTKICKNNVLVLVVKMDGSSFYELSPKTGGCIKLKNPSDNTVKSWPINELSTIDVLYPGVGFVPAFLQKQIRMTIVSETDWEPMINRSPKGEMIASPAFLGNLMQEQITEAVITVNKEVLESISGLMKNMGSRLNPLVYYIGTGLVLTSIVAVIYIIMPMIDGLEAIKNSLGIIGTGG